MLEEPRTGALALILVLVKYTQKNVFLKQFQNQRYLARRGNRVGKILKRQRVLTRAQM